MTDITELAQREKFEAWVMTQICISKSTLEGLRTSDGYRNSTLSGRDYNLIWNLWKAAGAELVEALEKAQSANEYLREQSAEWERKAISNFEDCAEMSSRIEELESQRKLAFAASNRWADKFREAEQRIAELSEGKVGSALLERENHHVEVVGKLTEHIDQLESRTVTVKLPDDEDGQAYGFGKWSNSKLPATAGTMTIAYCEDAWRAAFEVFSSATGIKVEAE